MLMSVDGKISTGDTDVMDFDKDLWKIVGAKEGLQLYYDIEKTTDLFSLNTGRVMAKIGLNDRKDEPKKVPVSFVIIDNAPHLTRNGILYLSRWLKNLYLVTTNMAHPVFSVKSSNIVPVLYDKTVDFPNLFQILKEKYQVDKLTIQSGGTLNAALIRQGLIDQISVVIAPVLIGGKDTPTLVDGESLHSFDELKDIAVLKLVSCEPLRGSYLHLKYHVMPKKHYLASG